jgi:uncharacterized SAM-binding protein YcdF (DUF218 family)
MFFVLSKILDFFATPLSWVLCCLLMAVVFRKRKSARTLVVAAAVILLVFSNPFLITRVTAAWEVDGIRSTDIHEPYDVGIVLGGSMRHYDPLLKRVVYSTSVDRLLQAMQLYHDGKIKRILLSGGSGFVNFQEWKESGLLSKVLLKGGVPAEAILLENSSRNTYENAEMTTAMLRTGQYGKRFLLITSAFHMRRSMMCFHKQGLQPDPYAVDQKAATHIVTPDRLIQPDAECLSLWDQLLHEWVGILMYKMMGYC